MGPGFAFSIDPIREKDNNAQTSDTFLLHIWTPLTPELKLQTLLFSQYAYEAEFLHYKKIQAWLFLLDYQQNLLAALFTYVKALF